MTTDGKRTQSTNHRIVRVMVVIVLLLLAAAMGLYALATWAEADLACQPDSAEPEKCAVAVRSAWIFGGLTLAAIVAAIFAWRKLDG